MREIVLPPKSKDERERLEEHRKNFQKKANTSIFFDGTAEIQLDYFYSDTFRHTLAFLRSGIEFIESSELKKGFNSPLDVEWHTLFRNSRQLHLAVLGLAVGCELLIKGLLLEKGYIIHRMDGQKTIKPCLIKEADIVSLREHTYSLGDLASESFLTLLELPCDEKILRELRDYLFMLNRDRNDIVHFAYDEHGFHFYKLKRLMEFISILTERTQKVFNRLWRVWIEREDKKTGGSK